MAKQGKGAMRLVYLGANAAWAFIFGDQLLQMANQEMFYRKRTDAVKAAKSLGLSVSKNGNVTTA